jgi:NitT/TauT family transport system substrate-binding protein
MIKAASRGAPVKTIGVLLQSTPAAVISPADRNIKTAKDLVGKTIAITPGDAVTPMFPLYLGKVGLNENQFKTVAGDAQVKMNAVTNRQADALLGFITEQGARMPGIVNQPVNMLRFSDAGLSLVSLGLVSQTNAMRTRADVYKRFMKAATRSVEEAMKDPAPAIAAMLKAYPAAGQPEAQLESLKLSQTLYFTAETKGQKPFRVARKTIDESLDTMVKFGGIEAAQRGKADDYFTVEFLP